MIDKARNIARLINFQGPSADILFLQPTDNVPEKPAR
jgi:hypothetical protein